MIETYSRVNEDGTQTGCQVSFRLASIYAIEHMDRWVRRPHDPLETGGNVDTYEPVPGCVTVYLGRGEFDIQADYADLLAKMKAINEWNDEP